MAVYYLARSVAAYTSPAAAAADAVVAEVAMGIEPEPTRLSLDSPCTTSNPALTLTAALVRFRSRRSGLVGGAKVFDQAVTFDARLGSTAPAKTWTD